MTAFPISPSKFWLITAGRSRSDSRADMAPRELWGELPVIGMPSAEKASLPLTDRTTVEGRPGQMLELTPSVPGQIH